MWKVIGIILILFIGFFIAGMMRPLLSQITTTAANQTDSSNTFALALLATFVVLPLVWCFVRAFVSLKSDKD